MAILQYAKAEHASGESEHALKLYEQTLALHALHPHLESDCWLNYGLLLDDGYSRSAEAAAAYRNALELAPSARASLRLGIILAESGELKQALEVWQAAQAWAPDNTTLKTNIQTAKRALSGKEE